MRSSPLLQGTTTGFGLSLCGLLSKFCVNWKKSVNSYAYLRKHKSAKKLEFQNFIAHLLKNTNSTIVFVSTGVYHSCHVLVFTQLKLPNSFSTQVIFLLHVFSLKFNTIPDKIMRFILLFYCVVFQNFFNFLTFFVWQFTVLCLRGIAIGAKLFFASVLKTCLRLIFNHLIKII